MAKNKARNYGVKYGDSGIVRTRGESRKRGLRKEEGRLLKRKMFAEKQEEKHAGYVKKAEEKKADAYINRHVKH